MTPGGRAAEWLFVLIVTGQRVAKDQGPHGHTRPSRGTRQQPGEEVAHALERDMLILHLHRQQVCERNRHRLRHWPTDPETVR